ncbi:hypothetical protein BWD09_12260 [Neisseria dentiae]|uniref:Uncharacterized protein n=1 Tax=Neisseria dentiae TaxID=194197 RepID=A0A1X3D227_9NEIS|nr:hypothetical protein BWD09_12260 [Neisseria dentiae]
MLCRTTAAMIAVRFVNAGGSYVNYIFRMLPFGWKQRRMRYLKRFAVTIVEKSGGFAKAAATLSTTDPSVCFPGL